MKASTTGSKNPTQFANKYAHRPELQTLGAWMGVQTHRIKMRLVYFEHRYQSRMQRALRESAKEQGVELDDDDLIEDADR